MRTSVTHVTRVAGEAMGVLPHAESITGRVVLSSRRHRPNPRDPLEPVERGLRPTSMDPDDRQAFIDAGLDPEAPSVRAALDLVSWELEHFMGFDATEP